MDSVRVYRKVKIAGKWIFAVAPLDRAGRPAASYVVHLGQRVEVSGGTYYLDHGHGKNRKRVPCGSDPEAVKRALKTQSHVIELRRRGMEVADAPEIQDSRQSNGESLRAIAKAFAAEPPPSYSKKSIAKYRNALDTFAAWSAEAGIFAACEVTGKTMARWIKHLQDRENLDAGTIVPKVRIVLGELRKRGCIVQMEDRSLPTITTRERDVYTDGQIAALLKGCTRDEYELFQVFLLTGLRYREVAFLGWQDIDSARLTIRVSRKRELGFSPKTYHERTIPVPLSLVQLIAERAKRLDSDGSGLIFATSKGWVRRGNQGGKADSKMLDKLRQLARREGLNCGRCQGHSSGKSVSCASNPICRQWGLHKFRHTYATSMLRDKVDIVTLSKWLGHKDLATTRIYLRALEAEAAQPQVESSTLATRFTGSVPLPSLPGRRRVRQSPAAPE